MRAVIAIRVSPRPQENVRYSPELQEQTCRDWAAQNGHEVVGVRSLSIIDLEDRDPESGNLANRILCQLFLSITVHEDRSVTVIPSDWVTDWMVDD